MGEVWHEDCPYNSIRAVDQDISSVAGEAEEDHHSVAETGGMDCCTALRLDDINPAFRCAGYNVISERCKYGNACRMLRVLSCLFCGYCGIDVLGSAKGRRRKDSFDGFG